MTSGNAHELPGDPGGRTDAVTGATAGGSARLVAAKALGDAAAAAAALDQAHATDASAAWEARRLAGRA